MSTAAFYIRQNTVDTPSDRNCLKKYHKILNKYKDLSIQSFAISNIKKFTPAFDTDVNFFMPKSALNRDLFVKTVAVPAVFLCLIKRLVGKSVQRFKSFAVLRAAYRGRKDYSYRQ